MSQRRTFLQVALAAAIGAAALPAAAQETIKIGLVTALSGQSARAGEAITRGLHGRHRRAERHGRRARRASSSWCAATTRRRRPRA